MAWPSRRGAISLNFVISHHFSYVVGLVVSCELVLEVEDLLEHQEALVRCLAVELLEELGHLGLPAGC